MPRPTAPCVDGRTLPAVVLSEAKDVLAVLYCRSAAPLSARPVPPHVAVWEAIVKFHGRLDLTVAVGPTSSWNVALNAASVGFVRVVTFELSVSLMMLGTLTDAVVFTAQLLPVQLSCPAACVVIVTASSTAAASDKRVYVMVYSLLKEVPRRACREPACLVDYLDAVRHPATPLRSNRRARTVERLVRCPKA